MVIASLFSATPDLVLFFRVQDRSGIQKILGMQRDFILDLEPECFGPSENYTTYSSTTASFSMSSALSLLLSYQESRGAMRTRSCDAPFVVPAIFPCLLASLIHDAENFYRVEETHKTLELTSWYEV